MTLVGLHIGSLLGGAVITESVFAVPGVGRLMVDSIFARDYPVIQALTLILAVHRVGRRSCSPTSCRWRWTRGWPDERRHALPTDACTAAPAGGAPSLRLRIGRIPSRCWRARHPRLFVACAFFPNAIAPYDPIAFDYRRAAAAAEPRALVRHRPVRPGHPVAHHRGLHHRPADRHLRHHRARAILGSLIGLFVGFYGGWADIVFGRLVDLVVTFPFLVIVIAIVAVLGPGLFNMYIAVERRRLGVLCPAHARRGDGAAPARLRVGGQGARLRRGPHPVPPHPAQRGAARSSSTG